MNHARLQRLRDRLIGQPGVISEILAALLEDEPAQPAGAVCWIVLDGGVPVGVTSTRGHDGVSGGWSENVPDRVFYRVDLVFPEPKS